MKTFTKNIIFPVFLILWNWVPAQDMTDHRGAYYCHKKKTSIIEVPPLETDAESITPGMKLTTNGTVIIQ